MSWQCACGARNAGGAKFCEDCGREHVAPTTGPPAYRETPTRVWQDSNPDDPCSEEGCDKRVRDHIREFREYGRRIHGRVVKL